MASRGTTSLASSLQALSTTCTSAMGNTSPTKLPFLNVFFYFMVVGSLTNVGSPPPGATTPVFPLFCPLPEKTVVSLLGAPKVLLFLAHPLAADARYRRGVSGGQASGNRRACSRLRFWAASAAGRSSSCGPFGRCTAGGARCEAGTGRGGKWRPFASTTFRFCMHFFLLSCTPLPPNSKGVRGSCMPRCGSPEVLIGQKATTPPYSPVSRTGRRCNVGL